MDLLTSLNLLQHVREATQKNGHTLDLIITSSPEFVSNIIVDWEISDHSSVLCNLSLGKPPPERKLVKFRRYKEINITEFRNDLSDALSNRKSSDNLQEAVSVYNDVLKELLDKHAPEQEKCVTIRHRERLMTEEVKEEKRKLRQLERKKRHTQSVSDCEAYKAQKHRYHKLLQESETLFNSELVMKNSDNPRNLFNVVNNILGRKQKAPLPPHESAEQLANDFGDFFESKVEKIHASLDSDGPDSVSVWAEIPSYKTLLSEFSPVTHDDVRKYMHKTSIKCCEMDPVPTWLVRQCEDELIPLISELINLSLVTSTMPDEYKLAILRPGLKKLGIMLILNSYRPISNLQYVSKIVERSVVTQIVGHMKGNNLFDMFQSAYLEGRSVETALLRVQNDVLSAMEKQLVTAIVLLDLSAAFDTVSHDILLHRLEHRCGITGGVLSWIKSYLSDRKQVVKVDNATSKSYTISCGVPQGSILGPILFVIYILPLGDIIQKHGILYHQFADDNQTYFSFKATDQDVNLRKMEKCVQDVLIWFKQNRLKCNGPKTDYIICGTRQQLTKLNDSNIIIDSCNIKPSSEVRNLGAIFDEQMSFQSHITAKCKAAYYQLFNLNRKRQCLTYKAAEQCIHAFVTCKLDFCNSLLFGQPKCRIGKRSPLQKVQNAAARCLTLTRKREHITPILENLNWLPIRRRIEYKMLLITYKAIHGIGPEYISDLVDSYEPTVSLRSAKDRYLLQEHGSKLKTGGDRAFQYAAPALWNKLPYDVRSSPSLASFKSRLKTHFYRMEYGVKC